MFFVSAPEGRPNNVRGNTKSATEITVNWDPIHPDHINSVLLGYTIYYVDVSGSSSPPSHLEVGPDERSCVIGDLKPFTPYNISVTANASFAESEKTSPITVLTDESGKYTPEFILSLAAK